MSWGLRRPAQRPFRSATGTPGGAGRTSARRPASASARHSAEGRPRGRGPGRREGESTRKRGGTSGQAGRAAKRSTSEWGGRSRAAAPDDRGQVGEARTGEVTGSQRTGKAAQQRARPGKHGGESRRRAATKRSTCFSKYVLSCTRTLTSKNRCSHAGESWGAGSPSSGEVMPRRAFSWDDLSSAAWDKGKRGSDSHVNVDRTPCSVRTCLAQ